MLAKLKARDQGSNNTKANKHITAAGAVSVIHFPSSRQILIMSRVFAVLFVCYFIQTVHTNNNNGWIGWNAEEAEDDHDDLFNIGGKQFNQQKSQLFGSVGLEEGNMEEFLTKTAKTMENQLKTR